MSAVGPCPICCEDMQGAATLPCGHMFDYDCVLSWLQIQQTCPTCRQITSPSSIIKLFVPTAADVRAPVRASRAAAAAAAATAEAADLNTNIGSLYVGNLHPNVTNAMLTSKFGSCGEILSVHVQRDPATQQSFGYAYVNFKRKEDAERALAMNGHLVGPANGTQPIRVRKYEKDPLKRKSPNVFVKNLDKCVNTALLHETFSRLGCGTVQSAKIPVDATGNNKGYGFVYFETEKACRKAIAAANGMSLAGKQLAVELNTKPPKAPVVKPQAAARGGAVGTRGRGGAGATGAAGAVPGTRDAGIATVHVYVKNLDKGVNSALLQETMTRFGRIKDCKVPVNADCSNKGFGFVYFSTDAECARAVAGANGMTLAGKQITVEINSKPQPTPAVQPQAVANGVYVRNLEKGVNSALLQETFIRFGRIKDCKVPVDATGNNKGFGFVDFETAAECARAVAGANGMTLAGKQITVEINSKKQPAPPVAQPQAVPRGGGAAGTRGRGGAGVTGPSGSAPSTSRGNYGQGARGTPGAGPANRGTRGQSNQGRGAGPGVGNVGGGFTPAEMEDIIRKLANTKTQ